MDLDICRWILDFIIRQSISDMTLDKLLRVLPLPIEDPTFKKAMLVRNIASEISKGVASEEMLVLMEHIEELDYQAGVSASQALKTAYCDVAVDFTARLLEESQGNYSDSVDRIWGERIGLMMDSSEDNIGLVSDDLRNWKDDILAYVADFVCEDDLLKQWRGTSYESLKSVRVYVDEAWANMGPSFLEQVMMNVGSEQIGKLLNPIEQEQDQGQGQGQRRINDAGKEMVKRKRILHPMRKCSRGAKLSYDSSDEMDDHASVKKTGVESVVKDVPPPPAAAAVGPSMTAGLYPEVIDLGSEENDKDVPSPVAAGPGMTVGDYPEVIDLGSEEKNEKDGSKEKNEKDGSKVKNDNKGNDCGGRRMLPPSTEQNYSPMKRKDVKMQNGMRRKRKFWSNLEEDTLLNAVRKYGTGNWKFILKQYKDTFDERTEGDLKDKWRNMIR